MLFDDPGIASRVGNGRGIGLQRHQVAHATGALEQVGSLQLVGDSNRVSRLALSVQRADRFENVTM